MRKHRFRGIMGKNRNSAIMPQVFNLQRVDSAHEQLVRLCPRQRHGLIAERDGSCFTLRMEQHHFSSPDVPRR